MLSSFLLFIAGWMLAVIVVVIVALILEAIFGTTDLGSSDLTKEL